MENVTLGLAFIAGFASFVSPCVLPLVPAYIGYMGGRVTHRVAAQVIVSESGSAAISAGPSLANRFSTVMHGLAFVSGFTFVFVMLGLLSTAFITVIGGSNINTLTTIIGRVGGVIIIFFGLHFMGVLPQVFAWLQKRRDMLASPLTSFAVAGAGSLLILWALYTETIGDFTINGLLLGLPVVAVWLLWLFLGGSLTNPEQFWSNLLNKLENILYSDTRRQMTASQNQGLAGSAFMGVVFSAGWTPCIGPIYGAVLTLAANTGDVGRAGPLLMAYSLGLGIPFLLTALLLDGAQGILRRLQKHMRKIELASGAFLLFIGLMIATGNLQALSQNFANRFADFSVRVETCVVGFASGQVYFNHVGSCLGGILVPTELDSTAEGTLEGATARMEFTYMGTAGENIRLTINEAYERLREDGTSSVTPLATLAQALQVTVYAPNGSEIAQYLPTNAPGELVLTEQLTLGENGTYLITVTRRTETDTGQIRFGLLVTESAPQVGALANLGGIDSLADSVTIVTGTAVGSAAPNFDSQTISGEPVSLAALRGRVILLNFWATWCGPCRIEMPEFEKAFQEYTEDGFTILAVNNRENRETAAGFAAQFGLSFPVVLDENGHIQNLFGVAQYPSTFIINREGVIVARHFGALTKAQIQTLIEQALAT